MASIRRRNDKWQVQIRRRGASPLAKSFLIRKDAETWARQMEVEADRRTLPRDPKTLERISLGDLVRRYRDEVTPRKRGHEVERIVFNAFLRHPLCLKRLSELTPGDFASYRDERLKSVKPNTLKREFSPLHNLFEIARDEWDLPLTENPLDKVRLDCPCNRRERRLQEGELERIIEAANKTKNPLVLPIILFALETGLRRSEILAARWSHLDIEKRLLTIPRAKNGHSRTIPLSRKALAVVQGLIGNKSADGTTAGNSQRMFPTTASALRLAWERLLARAGIEGLHFHDLRHEAISRFVERGLTIPEVARISGHRDMRMLFRYSHAETRRIIDQFDRWDVAPVRE